MNNSGEALIGMVGLALLALAAFAVCRWWQQKRVHRVERWVKDYLVRRYGEVPDDLHVNCSNDMRWPVLVSYNGRPVGTHHRLRFGCGGRTSTFALLSETEEKR